jgi:hypothetical protein
MPHRAMSLMFPMSPICLVCLPCVVYPYSAQIRFSKSTMWGDRIRKKSALDVSKAHNEFVDMVSTYFNALRGGAGGAGGGASGESKSPSGHPHGQHQGLSGAGGRGPAARDVPVKAAVTPAKSTNTPLRSAADEREAEAQRSSCMYRAFVAIANILTWGSIGFWVALLLLATTVLYTEVTAMSAKLELIEATNLQLLKQVTALTRYHEHGSRTVFAGGDVHTQVTRYSGGSAGSGDAGDTAGGSGSNRGGCDETISAACASGGGEGEGRNADWGTVDGANGRAGVSSTSGRSDDSDASNISLISFEVIKAQYKTMFQKQTILIRTMERLLRNEEQLQSLQNVSRAQLELATAEGRRTVADMVSSMEDTVHRARHAASGGDSEMTTGAPGDGQLDDALWDA